MSQTAQEVLNGALELPSHVRGRIAARLIESLDGPADPDATDAWNEETERRLQELDSGQVHTIPLDEAWKMIRGRNGSAAP